MKKIVFLALPIILFAIAINLPNTGITGFFVQVGLTGLALAKELLKTVLTFILNRLG